MRPYKIATLTRSAHSLSLNWRLGRSPAIRSSAAWNAIVIKQHKLGKPSGHKYKILQKCDWRKLGNVCGGDLFTIQYKCDSISWETCVVAIFLSIQFYIYPTSRIWKTQVEANYASPLAIELSSIGVSLQGWLRPTLCVTWFILYTLHWHSGETDCVNV